ncbi:MAG TPA: GlsB/YeaQ/YmgE family stress response membrane protein [Planctomycetota bacterium]|nr:GlsB/YeaQ/YmgE family stress response membrane protein [Planctomycetota bacterium]
MNWLGTILVGLLAGFLAGKFLRGRGFGLIGNLLVGLLGGLLGGLVFGALGFRWSSAIPQLLVSFLGALLLLYLVGRFRKRR